MKRYELVVRHEPDTLRESASAWWYSHHYFEEDIDSSAIETARTVTQNVGRRCANRTKEVAGYGCRHGLDELYRVVEDSTVISIHTTTEFVSLSRGIRMATSCEKRESRITPCTLSSVAFSMANLRPFR